MSSVTTRPDPPALRRILILGHRYLGILLSLLFVVWFASGIVMIYAGGMPRLTPQERLERLPALDFSRVKLSAAEAMQKADGIGSPARILLVSVMDRPAYRFEGAWPQTVFADTGEVLQDIGRDQGRAIAGRFANQPLERVHYLRTVDEPDQWTLQQDRDMPQFKFRIDDADATEVYVSQRTAEVTVLTTRGTRALAWVGTIPHWFYFSALRGNPSLWYRVVVWASALGCVLAALGLILAVTQFRRTRPFRLAAAVPYRGWMRWHYILGAVFGVFALTWVFSGLLSMEPFAWTNATGLEVRRDVFTGGPPELSQFGPIDAAALQSRVPGRAIKELEFLRIQDEHYYGVRSAAAMPAQLKVERAQQPYAVAQRSEPERLLVNASTWSLRTGPFSVDSLLARLKAAVAEAPVVEHALLAEYDSYYYSRGRQAPLPVLRIKFADPMQTWLYVDPQSCEILSQVHRLGRLERWLYNGLHSLDFSFWYGRRPLWDIGVIALCLGGLATSVIGFCLGVRRLRRPFS